MVEVNLNLAETKAHFAAYEEDAGIREKLMQQLAMLGKKIIVLDDDPTGVQTVHGISVYTDWSRDSIVEGFLEEKPMFFILTNSRSFTTEETVKVHRQIAKSIAEVGKEQEKEFLIISRSDSTLRGHYPAETQVLCETLLRCADIDIDGEIIVPFFKEGGRFTINNVHYVQEGDTLIPAGNTEFAGDKTFGYIHSHLGQWIEEKTEGQFEAQNVLYISLEELRLGDIEGIYQKLLCIKGFNKVVVNAMDYYDVMVFTSALLQAMSQGKQFIFRTAASFTKVLSGVSDKGLLTKEELVDTNVTTGGLVIIGSHVNKTSQQLEMLKNYDRAIMIEFNQHLILQPLMLAAEVERVVSLCEENIKAGKTVVVYTKRERVDLNSKNKEDELDISTKISDAVTSIVQKLKAKPKFIVAKGGITSSEIGTKGIQVKKATVAGQIKPGVPVWIVGEESKFPGMPYIIFPGNVGTVSTLKEVVELLD